MYASSCLRSVTFVQPSWPQTVSFVSSLACAPAGTASRTRTVRRRLMTRLHLAGRGRSLQPEHFAQDLVHDLVGSAADRAQSGVAGHALDLVLLHVARATVDLQAGVGDVEGRA